MNRILLGLCGIASCFSVGATAEMIELAMNGKTVVYERAGLTIINADIINETFDEVGEVMTFQDQRQKGTREFSRDYKQVRYQGFVVLSKVPLPASHQLELIAQWQTAEGESCKLRVDTKLMGLPYSKSESNERGCRYFLSVRPTPQYQQETPEEFRESPRGDEELLN